MATSSDEQDSGEGAGAPRRDVVAGGLGLMSALPALLASASSAATPKP